MKITAFAANRAVALACIDLGGRDDFEPNPTAMTPAAMGYQGFALLRQDR
jgi:hypothetical protein